jgi:hypothetical protein
VFALRAGWQGEKVSRPLERVILTALRHMALLLAAVLLLVGCPAEPLDEEPSVEPPEQSTPTPEPTPSPDAKPDD